MVDCPFCNKEHSTLVELKMHLNDDCLEYVLIDFAMEEWKEHKAEAEEGSDG